jgi:hypothetical protein
MTKRIKWTDELIRKELLSSVKILMLDRMPTASELKSIGRNDLHCKISRTKKYSGWAEDLGLQLARNETNLGNEYEKVIGGILESKGFKVEYMPTKHPYDLMLNGSVKVDVKVANMYEAQNGQNWWAFRLAKKEATCDIYILNALESDVSKERIFVIPGHLLDIQMLNMGLDTKYNKFLNRYDILETYSNFFGTITEDSFNVN